jgi:uncharacterized cupin superfamily protein
VFRKHISLALRGLKDVGVSGSGHPFDLELVRVSPNRTAWPFHSYSAQWELYVIISRNGEVRTLSETVAAGVGGIFIHPPDEAHQLRNIGSDDLVYYVIADHAPADVIHYPDSDKWFTKPQRKSFRMLETDYYDGEE